MFLALSLLAFARAFAHDAIDPVCGMKVALDGAQWKTSYGGDTYYFCNEGDLASFLKAPEKYASILSLTGRGALGEYRLIVKPRLPRMGEAAKIAVLPPLPLAADARVEALAFHLGPNREEVRRDRQSLHLRTDDGSWVFNRFFDRAGSLRLWVTVTLPDGQSDGVGFGFPVGDRAEHAPRATSGPLTMGEQHELMKRVGRDWLDVSQALAAERVDASMVRRSIESVRRDLGRLPEFDLHHFAEESDRHAALGRESDAALVALDRAVAADDLAEARRLAREIDGRHCTRCHLQFRWGTVDDLSRFPDLTQRSE
ncbi:MAG: YHS domain-containing protein [Planctomycetes bacterium]|nr:YHS domain-containing protein [Planctomycetota bacterium]